MKIRIIRSARAAKTGICHPGTDLRLVQGHSFSSPARVLSLTRAAASSVGSCSSDFLGGSAICFSVVETTPVRDCQHHQIQAHRRKKAGKRGETPEPTLIYR